MAGDKNQVWMFSEGFIEEPVTLEEARAGALEIGMTPASPGTGALLRMIAALRDAKAVVEIGSDGGSSGLWTLAGMNPRGVLTTIDVNTVHQEAAKNAFARAGIPSQRLRFISGRPLEMLPRLASNSYDMVTVPGFPENAETCIRHATRILKSGGALVLTNALWYGKVADPAKRDPHTVVMRQAISDLLESEDYRVTLLPSGEGVLVAVKK